MRFWDSSALVPLLILEESSDQVRGLFAIDDEIVASIITPIEVQSALWRRRHREEIDLDQHTEAEVAFADLSESWSEIADFFTVREIALRPSHQARPSCWRCDLATALAAADGTPTSLPFVTLDQDLALAARAEGFDVLP